MAANSSVPVVVALLCANAVNGRLAVSNKEIVRAVVKIRIFVILQLSFC